MTVWYELIHRPIGLGSQPKGFILKDETHVNRNGFQFGKVAYKEKLEPSVAKDYDMEPVHVQGKVELSSVTKDWLASNCLRTTPEVVRELVNRELLEIHCDNGWDYVDTGDLFEITKDIGLTKSIYKELQEGKQ